MAEQSFQVVVTDFPDVVSREEFEALVKQVQEMAKIIERQNIALRKINQLAREYLDEDFIVEGEIL